MKMAQIERGRFAPSPSGRMHLGNAFCALLAWLSCRAAGGRMVLRIEDLDPDRSRPQYARQLLEDLLWLGLDWDEGGAKGGPAPPYCQSRCAGLYEQALAALGRAGLLYPCFCTRAELHAAEAPHASDGQLLYSGRCRALTPAQRQALRAGRRPAIRLRVPQRTIRFTDGCQGPQHQDLAAECGDFILRRSDGVFAYQLAVVCDDGRMGVTQVVRGRDLLPSTARQLYLYDLLGLPAPRFYHIPLLLAPDGRRLSKRDGDLDLGALRRRTTAPQLIGQLAFWAGLLPAPEPADARDLIPLFRWEKVKKEDIRLPGPQGAAR